MSIDAHFLAVGINLRNLLNAAPRLPSYWRDFLMFTKDREFKGQWPISMYPVLIDKHLNAGQLGEYFWQDLFVAKHIIKLSPRRHIDVGSRIDGFVAHLACVRKVEVFDIRPLAHQIENVDFVQWDITNPNASFEGCADCVSCLHTLEHIGLGRYGDRLDADGWRKGLKSLIGLLEYGGVLWLSVPIGMQRVEFNAHRVFNPETIVDAAYNFGGVLERFFYLSESGVSESFDFAKDFRMLSCLNYSLGIFVFRRRNG